MSNNRQANHEIIQALKRSLPRGYSTVIATNFGVSRQYVSRVINTGNISHPIWDMALSLVQRDQKQTAKKKQKACQLLNIS